MRTVLPAGLSVSLVAIPLLLSCVGHSDNTESDPVARIADEHVPALVCEDDKRALLAARITARIEVDETLPQEWVCWVGVYNWYFGDEPDDWERVAYADTAFTSTCYAEFIFELEEDDYGVVIALEEYPAEAGCLDSAETRTAAQRMTVGGEGCDFTELIYVHYDCMEGYEIRYGSALEDRLQQAFGMAPAYNTPILLPDSTGLPSRYFANHIEFWVWSSENFLFQFESPKDSSDLCLAGVKDFFPRSDWYGQGKHFPDKAVGYTQAWPKLGARGNVCAVLRGAMSLVVHPWNMQEGVLRAATHELGHARAALTHAYGSTDSLHASDSCVMNRITYDWLDSLEGSGFFCDSCLQRISTSNWP